MYTACLLVDLLVSLTCVCFLGNENRFEGFDALGLYCMGDPFFSFISFELNLFYLNLFHLLIYFLFVCAFISTFVQSCIVVPAILGAM